MTTGVLQVQFLSDWHIGSGNVRRGDIDALVIRNRSGLPYLPGRTIKGIWRDACEFAARGLDDGETDGAWQKWVEFLFGAEPAINRGSSFEHPGALVIDHAYLGHDVVSAALGSNSILNAMTLTLPGTKIDSETGTAEDKTLRMVEVVCGGCTLWAHFSLPTMTEAETQTAMALLEAGARLIDDIGKGRTRGLGECSCTTNFELEVAMFDAKPTIPTLTETTTDSKPSEEWRRFAVRIRLESDALAPKAIIGNTVLSHSYIPGTYLLSAIASVAPELWNLIHADSCKITHGYPVIAGVRSTPVDNRWASVKSMQAGVEDEWVNLEKYRGGRQTKGKRNEFVSGDKYGKTALVVRMHNVVQDEVGRPTSDVVGVFTYEAIAAGQVFEAYLDIRTQDCTFSNIFEARIGSSKKAGYGKCVIKLEAIRHENILAPRHGKEADILLESDALILNENLRYEATSTGLAAWLSKSMGTTVNIESTFGRKTRIESWHSGWGLPRPTLPCLAAGSVFRVKFGEDVDLNALEDGGIGERRAEGFGRVRVLEPESDLGDGKMRQADVLYEAFSSEYKDPDFLNQLKRRAAPEIIRYKALLARSIQLPFSNSQKANLLSAIGRLSNPESYVGNSQDFFSTAERDRKEASADDKASLKKKERELANSPGLLWLFRLWRSENRREAWREAVEGVFKMITDPEDVWHKLGVTSEELPEEFRGEHWALAVRAYFDAIVRADNRGAGIE